MLIDRMNDYIPYTAAYESRDMSAALVLKRKCPECKMAIMGAEDADEVLVLKEYLGRVHGINVKKIFSIGEIIEYKKDYNKSIWIIFNADKKYTDNQEYRQVVNTLIYKNITETFKIVDMSSYIFDQFYISFVSYFIRNKQFFIDNEKTWADDISRMVYEEYIMSFMEGRGYNGLVLNEQSKYFGLGNDFFSSIEDGVWINVGASTGDTLCWAELNNLNFKKIYAVEGDKGALVDLKSNIQMAGLTNVQVIENYCGNDEDNFKLDYIQDKVSLINMDIEGAEKEALRSGKSIISRDKPVLAICAYHLADDLISIPKLIKDIEPSYQFYLRKYTSGTGRHYHAVHRLNELVLYAVSGK